MLRNESTNYCCNKGEEAYMRVFIMTMAVLAAVNLGVMAFEFEEFDYDDMYEFSDDSLQPLPNVEENTAVTDTAPSEAFTENNILENSEPDTLITQEQSGEDKDSSGSTGKITDRRVFVTAAFGTAGFFNLSYDKRPYNLCYGYVMTVNPYVSGRLTGELTTDLSSVVIAAVELGTDMFTSDARNSPYFGAGLGLAAARGEGKTNAGVTLSASAGVYLFRTSSFQLNLQTRFFGLFSQINGKYPIGYSGRVGVLF
ncbi:MAG: hypothetical protein LBI42_06010 [Chitinispirillales bacterium]|nr:hypothetical protein [Chitinispirillales bacterium]